MGCRLASSLPSNVRWNTIILHLIPSPEQMRKFEREWSKLCCSFASVENSINDESMAEQIRKFLQDLYDLLVGQFDLSAVQDPSNPDKKMCMHIHGSYSRTITFDQYPSIKITIKLTRLIPADHDGPSHTLIPWFLTGGRTLFLYDLLELIKAIRECQNSADALRSLLREKKLSPRFLDSLIKADRKFRMLLKSDSLDLKWLIQTSASSLKKLWLQTVEFRHSRSIYSGPDL